MTLVLGLVDDADRVWLAGDAASMSGWTHLPRRDPKVARIRTADGLPLVVGFTTSFRMGNLLTHVWEPPAGAAVDPFAWAVREAVPSLRTLFTDQGWTKTKDSREEGGQFIVGVAGALLVIDDDFQVEDAPRFAAVGAGRDMALASGHTALKLGVPDQAPAILRLVLGIAAHYSGAVWPPFTLVHT